MKLLKPLLIFFAGVFSAAMFHWMNPDYGAEYVYQQNVQLYARAHMYCYSGIIADWAEQDSVYIPLDSLEEEYRRQCGVWVDSIAKSN